ncbi:MULTISPECIES: BlaI/MecI/CopY family transcriptional regulator [Cryobacterium]|uniref:BlaI/MecI/CopY family transcriptional regulator n=1 Tax=Cryobacterium breve TaxID=1259258 RepID=A0ABY2IY44_9MICO|nr:MULTISPECIES: BlaI/MecI/CopY family transcriptional regulator [Cryobacterium]TFC96772.1 BlaI/MecI/CopY family transcriptional regulator [Cryobacterium sp. TmT3-12]TFC97431.1 BlaI/MecI/CopY family transcriptional regulator [Cryobacterium breve]
MVRPLGTLEQLVMDRMWSWGHPVAVREVLEDLQRERTLAYTTVMTVMDNLRRKGLLTRAKDGRAYVYRPAQTREQHTAAFMGEVLAGGADTSVTLLHFLDHIPPEEVASLRLALDTHLQGRTSTTP